MLTKHTATADWYAIDFSQFELDTDETATAHDVVIVEHEASRRGGDIDRTDAFIEETQLQWPNVLYKLKTTAEAGSPPSMEQVPGFYYVKGTVTTSSDRTFVGWATLNVTSEGAVVA